MNKIDLKENDVLEEDPGVATKLKDRKLYRVVKKRPSSDGSDACIEVALISLGPVRQLPFVLGWPDFNKRIASGKWDLVSIDPCVPKVRNLPEVPEGRRAKFELKKRTNMARIWPILDLGWGAFHKGVRGAKIAEIASGSITGRAQSAKWIRDLLIAYWRSGCDPFSLGPDYSECGAPSREERLSAAIDDGAELICPRRPGPRYKPRLNLDPDVTPSLDTLSRGGCAIHPRAVPIIERLIDGYMNDPMNSAEISITSAVYKGLPWAAIRRWVTDGLKSSRAFADLTPTRRQVEYIGRRSVDAMQALRRARGNRDVNMNIRPERGDYRDVSEYAGYRYEFDPFEGDIHLVDDITGLCIGRPNVLFTVDRYSAMYTGVYVTVDDPDFAHAGRAIHGAFSDKPTWCRSIGLEIGKDDWPCCGIPDGWHMDNASFAAQLAEVVPELLPEFGLARGYRADDKPQVETSVKLANIGNVHLYGMGVSKGPKERAKRDPSKDAYVSVQTFTRELVRWVIEDANHRVFPKERWLDPRFLKTRRNPTPYNVWCWSVENLGGPPRRYNPTAMMPRLLEKKLAKMTKNGLDVDGVFFDLSDDKAFQQKKALVSHEGVSYFNVYADGLTTRQVYIVPDIPTEPAIVCPLAHIHQEYADLTFETVRHRSEFRAVLDKKAREAQDLKRSAQRAKQRAAAKADLEKLKKQHSSILERNKTATSLDKGVIRDDQSDRDNLAYTVTMHGPASALPAPKGLPPEPSKHARPSCFQ